MQSRADPASMRSDTLDSENAQRKEGSLHAVRRHRLIQSLLIASTLLVGGCDWWRTYHLPLKEGDRLDQSLAIRLSKEVISQAGYNPTDFELFPIGENGAPGERYFGTGPALPPHGYVMWRHKAPGTGRKGLTVTIEQKDQVAVCKLSWWP